MTIARTGGRPSPLRRAAAAVALVALFAALLYLAVSAIYNWFVLLVNVASLGVAVVASWYVLFRRRLARIIAVGIAVLALLVGGGSGRERGPHRSSRRWRASTAFL
jgi:hypothetical protein